MAYNPRSLALYNSTPYGTAGQTINWYNYATADAVATVIAAGYFGTGVTNAKKLDVNDVIDCLCVADGVADRVALVVLTVPAGNITVAVNTDASGA
ncbi:MULTISPECIES: hypothetical protein [unclassified Mesorhizobium]|uniref:hypothetical protein n=1 Tax=unclassified Mesorhizobium TaxID=325217 RepID=UPI000FCB5525|nr:MULTISPECIES: hypothetical protein [unclassified Mesorhizobium]RUT81931.1 hypothetical protein EOD15_32270 [Mesorhizobium sp. M7A.T.Ca.US.000.02.2.1]RUT94372.1 hypothetical protein EOD12_33990 [Mesorhizobium sp. M7A.T.Ca.TU.009.02.1.1]RUU52964.1 hypothetical protein EOC99_31420 [Mesorhizobium sp. M7A.T.Ca.TU.009.01.1.1]RUU74124.1 hypothetical protein EOD03_27300 [Mesorhizobium sp. M7A.T.Ca.TU.009.01.1.2]